jgi:hypothetical protein
MREASDGGQRKPRKFSRVRFSSASIARCMWSGWACLLLCFLRAAGSIPISSFGPQHLGRRRAAATSSQSAAPTRGGIHASTVGRPDPDAKLLIFPLRPRMELWFVGARSETVVTVQAALAPHPRPLLSWPPGRSRFRTEAALIAGFWCTDCATGCFIDGSLH